MAFIRNIIFNLDKYYDRDEVVLDVMKRDYYSLPLIGCIFMNRNPRYFWIMILNTILEVAILIFHSLLYFKTAYDVMSINFTLCVFVFQLGTLKLFTVIVLIQLNTKRKELSTLHRELIQHPFEYELDEEEYMSKLIADMSVDNRKFLLGPIAAMVAGVNILIVAPLLDSAYGTFEYNGTELQAASWHLPIGVTYYPFPVEIPILFYLACFLQGMSAFYMFSLMAAAGWFFINVAQYICLHIKQLSRNVDKLEQRTKHLMKLKKMQMPEMFAYDDDNFISCYEECLKRTFVHHQTILRWTAVFQRAFPLALSYLTGTIVIAMSLLSIKTGTDFPGTSMANIFSLLGEVAFMGLLSFLGQKITDMGDELQVKVYSIKWFYCPKRIALELKIFLQMTQRPVELKDLIVTANHDTFANVMNSAYSYYNVILAL